MKYFIMLCTLLTSYASVFGPQIKPIDVSYDLKDISVIQAQHLSG